MKKLKIISLISLGTMGVGTLTVSAITSCGSSSPIIPSNKLDIRGDICYGFVDGYTPPNKAELTIPSGVNAINDYAFANCSAIAALDLGNVMQIGGSAFMNCYGLRGTITISPNSTTVGTYAFENCSKVTAFDLGGTNTIGINAFAGCSGITSISKAASNTTFTLYDGTGTVSTTNTITAGFVRKTSEISSDTITSVCATNGGLACGSVLIPPTLNKINLSAFAYCSSLTALDLNDVTTLGSNAFGYAIRLTALNLRKVNAIPLIVLMVPLT